MIKLLTIGNKKNLIIALPTLLSQLSERNFGAREESPLPHHRVKFLILILMGNLLNISAV